MRAAIDIPDSLGASALDAALEGLVGVAHSEIASGGIPPLYESGVVYRREPPGEERWSPPSAVLARGYGDCEDLASWRAAELRVTGEDPGARARVVRSGPRTWHAIVERADGSIEDPSRVLGMSDEYGSLAGLEARLDRIPGGWLASITYQGRGVAGIAPYADDALRRAASAACGEVGVIPGLDAFGRLARGALDALTPPSPERAARAIRAVRDAVRSPAPSADAHDGMSADAIIRIASQIARIAKTEAARKARDIERAVARAK